MTKRQEQAKRTKEILYETAIRLFEERGYDNVVVDDIIEEAQYARGTFYLYFKSKKDLAYHTVNLYDEYSEHAYEKVKDIVDFKEKLVQYARYYYEEEERNGVQILRALVSNNVLDGHKDIINAPTRSVYRVLTTLVQEGIEQGYLSDKYPVSFYQQIIVTAFLGVDYYWCTRDQMSLVDLVVAQMRTVAEGMGQL